MLHVKGSQAGNQRIRASPGQRLDPREPLTEEEITRLLRRVVSSTNSYNHPHEFAHPPGSATRTGLLDNTLETGTRHVDDVFSDEALFNNLD